MSSFLADYVKEFMNEHWEFDALENHYDGNPNIQKADVRKKIDSAFRKDIDQFCKKHNLNWTVEPKSYVRVTVVFSRK